MTGPDGDLSSPALPGNSRRAVPHPSGQSWMCGQCLTSGRSKLFKSRQAANGHMRVHASLAKQQAEGRASSSAAGARRKKIHDDLDLNKKAPYVHEEQHEELARTLPNLVQKEEAESRKMKRKEEVPYASGMSQSCSRKQLKSHQAGVGHNRVDNNQPQRQVLQEREKKEKELAGTLLKLEQCNLNKMKGDSSAMAEDGASLSAVEDAQRKQKHSEFDLNEPPADNENDDEKGA